ncbi:LacI family DNA-binding transcriptional regulator [Paenibacillus sp. GCM10023248]|uniref:LacI family DNA-binding transcriptional regulator n=1 Tax=Bacillales TaxID=1385 RepID=UPI0023780C18|nr:MULTISPECIES: LacI family DNA-binding transcriptional regulator [Bacillales]MDD9267435.1 LacI family DNA-binding transcriptional regulator [Paenibacillus sp. MAHUQ-63]MDR6882652.1 LacI family transcriptional regulator [Bacillus sp. 3255]
MSKPKQVTIVEVAEAAGVSIATVSNVLNRGGIRSSKETIRKVELAAEQLGYRRNTMAAGLSRNKTYEIGVIIPALGSYYGQLAEHLQLEAHNVGYHLSVFSSGGFDPAIERRHLEVLLERRVDGLICHGLAMGFETTRSIVNSGTPLVMINGWNWPEDIATGAVNLGFAGACEQSVKVLVDRGCGTICYIGSKGSKVIDERRRLGFQSGMAQHGSGIGHEIADSKGLDIGAYLSGLVQRYQHPIGIIAFDDHVALRILSAANRLGIDIPNRIRLIGINNDYIAKESYPGISSWDIPYYEQAHQAIGKLLHKFGSKEDSGEDREIEVPLTFIERETTKL